MSMLVLPGNILTTERAARWLPTPGEYLLIVDDCREEANQSEKGGSRLVVVNKILRGPGQATGDNGKTVYSSYQLSVEGMKYLRGFIEACELLDTIAQNGGQQIDPQWFIGRQYSCSISIRKDWPNVTDERPPNQPSTRGRGNSGAQPQQTAVAAPSMLQPVQPQQPQPPVQYQQAQPQPQPQQPYPPPQAQWPNQQQLQPPPQQQVYAPPPQQPMPQQPQMQQAQPQMQQAYAQPGFPPPPVQQTVAVPPPPPGYGQQR